MPTNSKEYMNQYRLTHRKEIQENLKQYRLTHQDKIRQYMKEYQTTHRNEIHKRQREYTKQHSKTQAFKDTQNRYKHSEKGKKTIKTTSTKYRHTQTRPIHKYFYTTLCPKCGKTGYMKIHGILYLNTQHTTDIRATFQHYHHKHGRTNIYTYCHLNAQQTNDLIEQLQINNPFTNGKL